MGKITVVPCLSDITQTIGIPEKIEKSSSFCGTNEYNIIGPYQFKNNFDLTEDDALLIEKW